METLGVHLPSLLIYLVNFLLVLGLLFAFAYKPILRLMDQRADRIRESLEASERAREEAASSQQAVEDQLVEARREAQRIMDQAREAGERFRAEEWNGPGTTQRTSSQGPGPTSRGSATLPSRKCAPTSETSPSPPPSGWCAGRWTAKPTRT